MVIPEGVLVEQSTEQVRDLKKKLTPWLDELLCYVELFIPSHSCLLLIYYSLFWNASMTKMSCDQLFTIGSFNQTNPNQGDWITNLITFAMKNIWSNSSGYAWFRKYPVETIETPSKWSCLTCISRLNGNIFKKFAWMVICRRSLYIYSCRVVSIVIWLN